LLDLAADPDETTNVARDPAHAADLTRLRAVIDAHVDLDALHADVLASQARRRIVRDALALGAPAPWDHPTPDDAARRYIGTGSDFWQTLERARLP